jgi:hypothetical protein
VFCSNKVVQALPGLSMRLFSAAVIASSDCYPESQAHRVCQPFPQQVGTPYYSKVLLVNFDEKWFSGMVARCNAKISQLLGVEKQYQHVFHKSHINKVMVVAFTGYAFDGTSSTLQLSMICNTVLYL